MCSRNIVHFRSWSAALQSNQQNKQTSSSSEASPADYVVTNL